MAEIQEVRVPDIGDDAEGVAVAEVLVAPGDEVDVEDSLIALESDKASMEVPSPLAGRVRTLEVSVGDIVEAGSLILRLEVHEGVAAEAEAPPVESVPPPEPPVPEPAAPSPKPAKPAATRPAPPPKPLDRVDEVSFRKAYASPAVRRFARQLGVDLGRVQGSGRNGRITRDDVREYVKAALARPAAAGTGFELPPMPEIDFSKYGPVKSKPLGRIRKLSARNVHRSWLHVPHVTQHDEADVTELEAFRKAHSGEAERQGFKLTPVAFLLKAVASALKAFPDFNSSLAPGGESLILKQYFHIGVAVNTPGGLVVPVIRDVDQKSIFELAGELFEVSSRARDGKLLPKDFQGGCFTISSLGGIGGTAFTPIVNAPEVAILGASRHRRKPVWQDGEFVPRLMLPLSLSYDHRVIDGTSAARFIVHLSGLLSDVRRLLL